MNRILVVTGPPGSGKTEFSQRACRIMSFRYVNVGDLLEDDLRDGGVTLNSRRDIGPAFLRESGVSGYLDVLSLAAKGNCVIDGVRLSTGVLHLKKTAARVFHVHRTRSERAAPLADRTFERELEGMAKTADLVVPFLPMLSDIDRTIECHAVPFFG